MDEECSQPTASFHAGDSDFEEHVPILPPSAFLEINKRVVLGKSTSRLPIISRALVEGDTKHTLVSGKRTRRPDLTRGNPRSVTTPTAVSTKRDFTAAMVRSVTDQHGGEGCTTGDAVDVRDPPRTKPRVATDEGPLPGGTCVKDPREVHMLPTRGAMCDPPRSIAAIADSPMEKHLLSRPAPGTILRQALSWNSYEVLRQSSSDDILMTASLTRIHRPGEKPEALVEVFAITTPAAEKSVEVELHIRFHEITKTGMKAAPGLGICGSLDGVSELEGKAGQFSGIIAAKEDPTKIVAVRVPMKITKHSARALIWAGRPGNTHRLFMQWSVKTTGETEGTKKDAFQSKEP